MFWYLVAFLGGAVAHQWLGHRLTDRVFGKGEHLKETLRGLNPDSFKRLHDAIEDEEERRAAL